MRHEPISQRNRMRAMNEIASRVRIVDVEVLSDD
jgi:hypothetical protein